jgi:hypothetical protein
MITKGVLVALVSFIFLSQAVSARPSSLRTTKLPHEQTTRHLTDPDLVAKGSGPFDFLLKKCEGDCDLDIDCEGGLICWQRDSGDSVPGCEGGEDDDSRTDYCIVDPDVEIEQASMHPSKIPSGSPSAVPSDQLSTIPSDSPSTAVPSDQPSTIPSDSPSTAVPSDQPSTIPSDSNLTEPVTAEGFVFMQCEDETQNCCNGLDTICDLRVDEILYASVHNAMATFEDDFQYGPNHRFNLEGALEAGYRGLNMAMCNCNGEYQLCQGFCQLGTRNPAETFGSINQFLDQNPTETIIITLEINNGGGLQGEVDLDAIHSIFYGVEGLLDKLYIHETLTDPWPTLGEVVAANTVRIVAV